MESTTELRSIDQILEARVSRLEESSQEEALQALEWVGDQLSIWEHAVRTTSNYALAQRIGELLEKVGQHWLALTWYQWIVAADEEVTGTDLMTHAIRAKGRMFIRLGMHEDALPLLKQVEARMMQQAGYERDLALLWQNIAVTNFHLHKYEPALEHALQARHGFAKLGEDYRVGVIDAMIGTYLWSLNRYEEAFEYLTRSRAVLEQYKDYRTLARCWHNYAELMRDWGRMEEAIAAWRMSLEMKKRTQDYAGQVNTILSITEYLIAQKDWHYALPYITQAFPLCHTYKLFDHELDCLDRWSSILFALGRYAELEVCASRALFLKNNLSEPQQVGKLLKKIAGYFEEIGFSKLANQCNVNAFQILG